MSLPAPSLRARLLWFLLAAIALAALLQGWVAYRSARAEADQIFDYHMQQMALSLRSGLPGGSWTPGAADLAEDENYDFVVQVWSSDGLRVFESSAGAALPQRAVLGFSDVRAHGSTYRVYSLQTPWHVIQVAQDMAVRRSMAGALALRTIAPVALMAPLLMLVVWWVVSSSLAPVARVRSQLAQRHATDLDEVSELGLPDEIRPLVHELNLLLVRVRQAFEAQKNFVADAAHELRSPLAALKLQAQGLQRAHDDTARELAVSRLTAGIDRAARLVEQLLVLARQQSSPAVGAAAEPVALAALARQVLGEMAPMAQQHGIDLGLGAADEALIPAYPEALRVLLRNLLDNAIKYTPAGGTVDLELQRRDDRLVLSVEDSGPGIPEAERQRVLDRFYRVAGTDTTGSGLGLAIVKSIADLHNATLELSASSRLAGLRVDISFPLPA
ncbi:MAG: sensor histidine kinase N-terminal domain-containing protein [Burkholderiales bacterium]|nr:sensor histidine kinase N-terminal domain-containing protein [Burkholderiales bacterium]